MNDSSNSDSPLPASVCNELLAGLESTEHMLFAPMSQQDYDRLRVMYSDWVVRLGYSPEAVMICDALDYDEVLDWTIVL